MMTTSSTVTLATRRTCSLFEERKGGKERGGKKRGLSPRSQSRPISFFTLFSLSKKTLFSCSPILVRPNPDTQAASDAVFGIASPSGAAIEGRCGPKRSEFLELGAPSLFSRRLHGRGEVSFLLSSIAQSA